MVFCVSDMEHIDIDWDIGWDSKHITILSKSEIKKWVTIIHHKLQKVPSISSIFDT